MRTAFVFFFCLCCIYGVSQQGKAGNNIKLTAGRILFGTGDVPGYGVNIEYSRRLNANKKPNKHFFGGIELSFESGSKQPKVINPTLSEFFSKTYHSTTNIVLTPKLIYYPFNKTFAKGINISGGLSIGYTSQNREFQASYRYDSVLQTSVRRSYLEYINKAIFGYRITTGYEWWFKKILVGARLDFDSYTNGDINTLIGLKTGIRF